MTINFVMLRWWLIFCSSGVAAVILYNKGMFAELWLADHTALSFVAIGIYVLLTCFIGRLTYVITRDPSSGEAQDSTRYLQGCWYVTEMLMAIGMMGTLIGFMMMLGPALAGIDPNNIEATKEIIFSMANGMSTAVVTTLVGLILSQMAKLQLVNLEIEIGGDE